MSAIQEYDEGKIVADRYSCRQAEAGPAQRELGTTVMKLLFRLELIDVSRNKVNIV